MNPDQPPTMTPWAGTHDQALNALLEQIRSLVQSARKTAATTINALQVSTRFEIGRVIVEHEQQGAQWVEDLLKEPDVLEFLSLDEKAKYSESDLETTISDKLEHFLLGLGKGFLFEARQKRFTFDDDHFFVDLVFYNRLLRCYVLIDLKIGRLTHQDLGQMQMYVNYFDRYVKTPDERPTVGMILCKQKRTALVELTLPKDANIHASQYQLYLPSKEDLKQRLLEWAGEEDEQ
jgi:predicted nuclease of restriction endonuclease-like (RecB) superfamily